MRQIPVLCDEPVDLLKLCLIGKMTEHEKIYYLLKAEAVIMYKAPYDILNINTSLIELSVTGTSLSVYHLA